MRLIDADAVIPKGTKVTEAVIAVHNALVKAPTIDAVPVVRCWECKHRETIDCPKCHEEWYFDEDNGSDYYIVDQAVDSNGFCECGERRGDDAFG